MRAGHQIRDCVFNLPLPQDTIDTGELFDCVVVGGGVSGLSAALFFNQYAGPKLMENELADILSAFGGGV